VQGASFGGARGREQAPELDDRYLGGIDIDSLVTQRPRLDDVNIAFDLMHAQDGIRGVLAFGKNERIFARSIRPVGSADPCCVRRFWMGAGGFEPPFREVQDAELDGDQLPADERSDGREGLGGEREVPR
jgi:hypothetical protein